MLANAARAVRSDARSVLSSALAMLTADEVRALWARGVSVDACYVPDELLREAMADRRVQRACSWSSMGTAETYWEIAGPSGDLRGVRGDGLVVPEGQRAFETAWADRADDRDVVGVLWEPEWRQQERALARAIPEAKREGVLEACARMLTTLERDFGRADEGVALLLDWLVSIEGIVGLEAQLDALRDERHQHLAWGLRARWITRDVASAFEAVDAGAAYVDRNTQPWRGARTGKRTSTRLALFRLALGAL